jgi:hypothetical protein
MESMAYDHITLERIGGIYVTKEEAEFSHLKSDSMNLATEILTPRKLLQIVGTEAGRELVHPNLWVNALMADYKTTCNTPMTICSDTEIKTYWPQNWIITDVRFENEAKAIKDRQGFLFRVERSSIVSTDNHPSETSLDNYMQFTDYIRNDGTVEDLVEEVKSVLTSFNIIKLL